METKEQQVQSLLNSVRARYSTPKHVARKLSEELDVEIQFEDCDGLRLGFPDASFQYVLLNQMIGHVPLRENRVTLFQECARVVSQGGRVVLSYMDNRVAKAKRLYGVDRPPDPRSIEEAAGYSVLEPGDVFANPVRGHNKDGTLDEDPVFGYSHEYTREDIELELADGGLRIMEIVSAMELSDETTPYYVVSAVPRTAAQ